MTEQKHAKSDSVGPPPPRWAVKLFSKTQLFLNLISGGRLLNTLSGSEVCFVSMTGAKSGKRVITPLMYVPYQEGVLLVASMGGAPRNPVWYYNIAKNPDIEVRYRGNKMRLHARQASAEEKSSLWPICDSYYADYAEYRQRTDRDIPIFVCLPGN